MSKSVRISNKMVDDLTATLKQIRINESTDLRTTSDDPATSGPKSHHHHHSHPHPQSSSEFLQTSSAPIVVTSKYVRGTCTEFCPSKEIVERIRLKLVHYYEMQVDNRKVPGTLVKCYRRPAAGILHLSPKELRTVSCLQETMEYLFKNILQDESKPFCFIYDFIFDRLRAIRQDIIIQNFKAQVTVKLFEPIVMFLAYCRYKLCQESLMDFDPKICEHHLHECLNKTLSCYDTIWRNGDNLSSDSNALRRRAFIEAIYLIVNLGKEVALKRYFSFPDEMKTNVHITNAYRMSLYYMLGNYYRCNRILEQLPHILCATASMHLPSIRKNILKAFSIAYGSKCNPVSLTFIRLFTLHPDDNVLATELQHYKIEIISNSQKSKCVQFVKGQFDSQIELPTPRKQFFVDSKFREISNLNELFHLRDFI